jgi:hypothetical protein
MLLLVIMCNCCRNESLIVGIIVILTIVTLVPTAEATALNVARRYYFELMAIITTNCGEFKLCLVAILRPALPLPFKSTWIL